MHDAIAPTPIGTRAEVAVSLPAIEVLFTDLAAVRAFEYGIDHEVVITALGDGHFKQHGHTQWTFVHYVKLAGRPFKVVTGRSFVNPADTVIITLIPLVERR